MTYRVFQIGQGTPVVATATLQLLPTGVSGSRGALRRLVHPDAATFPPVVYYRNPDRLYNFDGEELRHPITAAVRTLTATRTVRFEEETGDVVVVEEWTADGGLSVPLFLFQQLYEYLVNPPDNDPLAPSYILWEPRDQTTDVWRVELLQLQVGGGSPGRFSMRRWQAGGGPNDPRVPGALVLTPTDVMDVSPTALLDQPVFLTMRLVSVVEA